MELNIQKFKKSYFAKAFILLTLFVFMTNCASFRSKKTNLAFEENKEVYIRKNKSERTDFFKVTDAETRWVDSIYNKMTLDEKIGQLFMVSAYSNKDSLHKKEIDKLIQDYKVGGLVFFQGGPIRQAQLTNHFQSKAKVPLFIAIDAEWGLSMRLDSTYRYPWNMTLGAIQDLKLIEKVGRAMGKENKRMGIQFNFAPVIDINTNPNNPIIGNRSFGESKINVANKAIALMSGEQKEGIFCTGKHFPGHGDTSTDSHKLLPTLNFSESRIDLVEMYPYKKMFDEGLVSVMVAHLNIPSLEKVPNTPTTASYNLVTNILKNKLEFDGLIFTDGLPMKGAANFKPSGDLELACFLAGNDILLCSENVPLSIEKIRNAYNQKQITEERLAYSVKKILRYKFKSGLNNFKPIDTKNLLQDINPVENDALQYELYENAVTVLQNKNEILPIKDLNQKIAYVKLGDAGNSEFVSTLKKYTAVTEIPFKNVDSLNIVLKQYKTVIVGLHKSDKAWAKHDFTKLELENLKKIAKKNKVILDVFAKPYTLLPLKKIKNIEGIVLSHQNCDISQIVSAELIFGAIQSKGKLPVSIGKHFDINAGLTTQKLDRLGFSTPKNVAMDPMVLSKIDSIAKKAIDRKMAPGIQILVARKGKVIMQKSYGYHTYEKKQPVSNTDLFDLASISKMVGTLPNVMQEFDKNKINLETRLGDMYPPLANSNKKDIKFVDLLTHTAGLVAWIPFYKATLDKDNNPSPKYYSKKPLPNFNIKIADSLYLRDDYRDTIMERITKSKVSSKKEFVYSDLTFILLKEYLEYAKGEKLPKIANENFFGKLGMNYTLYNPLQKFEKKNIVPTEIDSYFRQQVIQGYVHDMGAAMMGGVAGHAGLFSNAMDVAKMMQMYLQKGNYGGEIYFSEQTFDAFNNCYYCDKGIRRGLGFDKPQLEHEGYPTCDCVSKQSFGHTGFTGNIAWADPISEIVYVFLSNRTYSDVPTGGVNFLAKERIREGIQKIIQEAIIK